MTAIAATRLAPSEYSVDTRIVEIGDVIENRSPVGTDTYRVIREPIYVGYNLYTAAVREVGGQHDGNVFTAYLRTR